MTNRELKKLLKTLLDQNEELIEHVESCYKVIFAEDAQFAIRTFIENMDNWDNIGCVHGLEFLRRDIDLHKARVEEYKAKRKEDENRSKEKST